MGVLRLGLIGLAGLLALAALLAQGGRMSSALDVLTSFAAVYLAGGAAVLIGGAVNRRWRERGVLMLLGGVAVIAADKSAAHQLVLGLRGRPRTVLIGPDAERPAGRLADIDTVVAAGAKPPINTWRPIFEGRSLKVFERASPPHLHVTDGEPLGSSAVSG